MTPFSQTPHSPKSPFSVFQLHPALKTGLELLKFTVPTTIQELAIPPALQGHDILGCAMTGSGKTAAFALPILHKILTNRGDKRAVPGTKALIVVPTRELAVQIKEHFEDLGSQTSIRVAAIYGGVGSTPQKIAWQSGVDIIIATPGRLLDHFSQPYGKLPHLDTLVLDEADRMLDMGFLPDIHRILRHLPKRPRQNMFFSATMPEPIVALTEKMLVNPVSLDVERIAAPADGITQTVFPVPDVLKSRLFLKMCKDGELKNVLAFTRTKYRAMRLAEFLKKNGVPCVSLHGSLSQNQRNEAMKKFRTGECPIMIATDIAARGIDVQALSHVVNFDVPHVPEDYIHRVGRTARAGMVGDAFSFVSPQEEFDFKRIEKQINEKLPRKTLEGFDYTDRSVLALETREPGEQPRGARNQRGNSRRPAGRSSQGNRSEPRRTSGAADGARPAERSSQGNRSEPRRTSGNTDGARPVERSSSGNRSEPRRTSGNPDSARPTERSGTPRPAPRSPRPESDGNSRPAQAKRPDSAFQVYHQDQQDRPARPANSTRSAPPRPR